MLAPTIRLERIVIAICTCERPQSLERCVASLKHLELPAEADVSVIIIDNENRPAAHHVLDLFRARGSNPDLQIDIVHEPRRGIATARNAAITAAAKMHADWIVFLDDDQTVETNWLAVMWQTQMLFDADVVSCRVKYIYPSNAFSWIYPKKQTVLRLKKNMKTAATNGVLISMRFIAANSLKFNERYNFTGGEDRDFFSRIYQRGGRIAYNPWAVAYETVPESRFSLWELLYSAYYSQAVNTDQSLRIHGILPVFAVAIFYVIALFITSLLYAFFALPAMVGDYDYGRHYLFQAARRLWRIGGVFAGFTGALPQPYRTVHGL